MYQIISSHMKPRQPIYTITPTRKLAVMEKKHMYDWETESMP
jgi:hypothetical protein